MKTWLVILLLFITAAASFVPCCTGKDCCDEQSTAPAKSKQPEGACSPFFACGGCTISAEISRPIQMTAPAASTLLHVQPKIYFILSSYSSAPWQPPRVA